MDETRNTCRKLQGLHEVSPSFFSCHILIIERYRSSENFSCLLYSDDANTSKANVFYFQWYDGWHKIRQEINNSMYQCVGLSLRAHIGGNEDQDVDMSDGLICHDMLGICNCSTEGTCHYARCYPLHFLPILFRHPQPAFVTIPFSNFIV